MITPEQMLQSAREALGEDRVDKITGINEVAQRRLEEYEAAIAAGADTTEVTRQLATGTLPGDLQHSDPLVVLVVGGATTNVNDDNESNTVTTANEEEA
jgi:hypothetical protein